MEGDGQQEFFFFWFKMTQIYYSFGAQSQNRSHWTEIKVWAGLRSFPKALGRSHLPSLFGVWGHLGWRPLPASSGPVWVRVLPTGPGLAIIFPFRLFWVNTGKRRVYEADKGRNVVGLRLLGGKEGQVRLEQGPAGERPEEAGPWVRLSWQERKSRELPSRVREDLSPSGVTAGS